MKSEITALRSTCPSCQGARLARFGARGAFTLARCDGCGLVFVREQVTDGFVEEFYDGQSCDAYVKQDTTLRQRASQVMDQIQAMKLPGNRVLDVGCGSGLFMEVARSRGLDCVGIDADPARVAFCRQRGLNAIQGLLPHPEIADGSFDLVWLSHVIEHVPVPPMFIAQLARMLRPDGLLCVLTPNVKSVIGRICRSHSRFVIPPEHLTYWSRQSLERAMGAAGLRAERIYAADGTWQFKEVLAHFLKLRFLQAPTPMPSATRFTEGKAQSAQAAYRLLLKIDRLAEPVMERLGGLELRGFFRKRSAA